MSEPVTKQDLLNAVAELKACVDERCEAVETKLLTAFHEWASPSEARARSHAAAIRALDLEMESLDDRLKKLEGNPPKAA